MYRQSYVHGTSDVPLIGETIGRHFDGAAARWADRDALVVRHQDICWSWAELRTRVDDFAAGLIAQSALALGAHRSAAGREVRGASRLSPELGSGELTRGLSPGPAGGAEQAAYCGGQLNLEGGLSVGQSKLQV